MIFLLPETMEIRCSHCIGPNHTCQLLRIFRKLYGFLVISQGYGRRGISLRIYLFTKSLIFLRLINIICWFCYINCQTSTLNKCAKPYKGWGGIRRNQVRRRRSCGESLPRADVQVIQTSSKFWIKVSSTWGAGWPSGLGRWLATGRSMVRVPLR